MRVVTGTLLNRLFGTTFDVMDETRRQQTTKGKYIDQSTLVLVLTQLEVSGCAEGKTWVSWSWTWKARMDENVERTRYE